MAKAKKEKELNVPVDAEVLNGCDFCMQFDYDEPHIIGASENADGVMEIVLKSYMDVGITFKCPDTGKKLRLFARPLSDKGKKILEEQEVTTDHRL
jgi:hypothetical protein